MDQLCYTMPQVKCMSCICSYNVRIARNWLRSGLTIWTLESCTSEVNTMRIASMRIATMRIATMRIAPYRASNGWVLRRCGVLVMLFVWTMVSYTKAITIRVTATIADREKLYTGWTSCTLQCHCQHTIQIIIEFDGIMQCKRAMFATSINLNSIFFIWI